MGYKTDLNKAILKIVDKAIVARQMTKCMAESQDTMSRYEWFIRWIVFANALSVLTGRDSGDCVTRTDLENIRVEAMREQV